MQSLTTLMILKPYRAHHSKMLGQSRSASSTFEKSTTQNASRHGNPIALTKKCLPAAQTSGRDILTWTPGMVCDSGVFLTYEPSQKPFQLNTESVTDRLIKLCPKKTEICVPGVSHITETGKVVLCVSFPIEVQREGSRGSWRRGRQWMETYGQKREEAIPKKSVSGNSKIV